MCGLNPFGQHCSVNGFLVTHRALHESTLCFSLPAPFSLCTVPPTRAHHSKSQASFLHTPPHLFPTLISCLEMERLNYEESDPCLVTDVLALPPSVETHYLLATCVLTVTLVTLVV